MNIYKAKISYNGMSYEGWQIQPDGHRTIQGELNKALAKIAKSNEISTLGSGRTDSGVHANAQIVKIQFPFKIEVLALRRALNSHLPKSIRVLAVDEEEASFHPVKNAHWKEYQYLIYEGECLPPQYEGLWTHVTYGLDEEKMKAAIKVFEGQHNFINFSTKGTEVASTIRRVFKVEMKRKEVILPSGGVYPGKLYHLSFYGEGFLKQMVRLMVGSVIDAGRSKLMPLEIESFLGEERSTKCAAVAPADGLYLNHVEYDQQWPSQD